MNRISCLSAGRILTVALSLGVAVPAPSTLLAQARAKPRRGVAVPRVIRGQTIESAVIYDVVLIFDDLPVAEEVPAGDDLPIEQRLVPKPRVILFSGTFDELVYGSDSNAANARVRLEQCLKQKLDKIDRISKLTDAQRRKLQLAGRGDIKRLFDRAEKLRDLCDRSTAIDLNEFQKWTEQVRSKSKSLRQPLTDGPFNTDSLFARCMKTTLTAEQAAQYARFEATPPYEPPQRGRLQLEGAIELRGR